MPAKNRCVGRKDKIPYMPECQTVGRKGLYNRGNVCQLTQVCRIGLKSPPYPILASPSALTFLPEKKNHEFCQQREVIGR